MAGLLDRIESPSDLKALSYAELDELAKEVREEIVTKVNENGGHLASSLGTVELTIALHRIYRTPSDKIVWDVGHQSYAHKLLTGRRHRFSSLRQYGGLSGFPAITESAHDSFGVGHAGTSVSAALGMALARDYAKKDYHVVAVIGDGSMGSGMAFEAVNHAGHLGTRLTVVLNDNGMSISPSTGAFARLLSQSRFDPRYESAKRKMKQTMTNLPFGESAWAVGQNIKSHVEKAVMPGTFWEELGFRYLGPIEGHNIRELEAALARARDYGSGPTLVHVITTKGKGHAAAEENATKFHGVSPVGKKPSTVGQSYSSVFGQTVVRLMRQNDRVVAISAAMVDGTGLAGAAKEFPSRVLDVGICEQHAVTLAGGLASQGYIPIVAIYSTFLQRSYDQIVHDVCVQNLPVIFAIDRAGIVGDDGKTHQGSFDISFLRSIPEMAICAPRNENELQHLLFTATNAGRPIAIRYPRGNGPGTPLEAELRTLPLGKGEVLRQGDDAAIFAIGSTVEAALAAADRLATMGIHCRVIDARFAKPLDEELLSDAAKTGRVITVEENVLAGGFGSAVLEFLARRKDARHTHVECIAIPDRFVEHGPQELFRSMFDLDADGIAQRVTSAFPELLERTSGAGKQR